MLIHAVDEASEVARLRWRWACDLDLSLPTAPRPGFLDAVQGWLDDPVRTVWLATTDRPVGMVSLTEHTRMPSPSEAAGGRWGYLGHLYVRPEARGAGVGEALVRELLAESARRGHTKVVLSPTAPSVPLYLRCGFTDDNDLLIWRP